MTEGPYKLPEGWRWVRLGEVCETKMGGTPSTKDTEYWEPPEIIWVTPEDLEKCELNRVFSSRRLISRAGLEKSSAKLFPHKTVLLSTTATIGKVGVAEKPLSANQQISGIICGDNVNPEFLAYYLLRLGGTGLKQLGGTATATHINQTNLRSLLIPLPPLEEQRRIVARIEELMARVREAKRLRQQAKQDAKRLMQAALAEVFPRPGTEPPTGWRWVRLGEVARRESVIVKLSDQPNSTFRYLGMEHVAPGQWEEPCPVEVRGSDIRSQVIAFRPGLVLYGKLRPYLNKVVVPSNEGVASTEFVPIAVRQDMVSPHYLGAFLRCPGFVAYAGRNIAGSRQPRTRLDALWNALIPLPPLDEQRRIVAHLEAVQEKVRALKEAQAATDAELQRLEQAVLDKAFRGEL